MPQLGTGNRHRNWLQADRFRMSLTQHERIATLFMGAGIVVGREGGAFRCPRGPPK